VQDGPGDDQVAVQRRPQVRVVGRVAVGQVQTQPGDRQGVLQQPAGKRVELVQGGGQPLEGVGVPVQERQDQPAQRHVGDVRLGQAAQLRPHRRHVVARVLDQGGRVEALGPVLLVDRPDVLQVDLGPVALVLAVDGAELVEVSDVPVALAGLEPAAVGPDHERDGATQVAEAAGVEGFALARR
jgi:hypothetical protein